MDWLGDGMGQVALFDEPVISRVAGVQVVALHDKSYPTWLKEIPSPPKCLYVLGSVALLERPQIAIVGARKASTHAHVLAGLLAAELSEQGWLVTSGMALGVDGAAHRGALKVNRPTVAVWGSGLSHCYPRVHRDLACEIVRSGGALVSEYSPETPPKAFQFPRRNRIISGLSRAVLVVEATLKSGSLGTARYALEQGREVFACPGLARDPRAEGCHELIRQGAKLVERVDDVLEELLFE